MRGASVQFWDPQYKSHGHAGDSLKKGYEKD